MVLSALLLAAAVQVAPEPPATFKAPGVVHGRITPPARRACHTLKVLPVDQSGEGAARPFVHQPPGALQYAVMRSIDGCSVPTPIRQVRPAR